MPTEYQIWQTIPHQWAAQVFPKSCCKIIVTLGVRLYPCQEALSFLNPLRAETFATKSLDHRVLAKLS
jgi:hypothetical protein